MAIFKKKKEEVLEGDIPAPSKDMMSQLEAEMASLDKPPMPARPGVRKQPAFIPPKVPKMVPRPPLKPVSLSAPKTEKLSQEQMAKLPLFMKVEEYDRVIKELSTLVTSLKSMEDIMKRMTKLEREETEETVRWQEQLYKTQDQVRLLLAEMPETGKIRALLDKKRKGNAKEIQTEIDLLKKELSKTKGSKPSEKPKEDIVSKEVKGLSDSMKALQDEMKHMHLEFKMLNSLTQLKSSKMVKGIKKETKKPAAMSMPLPSSKFKKSKVKSPWE